MPAAASYDNVTDESQRVHRGVATGPGSLVAVGEEQYSVVFDAGSTGSRIHVFKFVTTTSGLELISDTFEQLKPGLGDAGWAANPRASAASLQPLLDTALASVPPALQVRI